MIEQKAIFEAAQTAFKDHHPKFPFPKKNNLDEQTNDFKRAFMAFSVYINAMHERKIQSIATRNVSLNKEARDYYDLASEWKGQVEEAIDERDSARTSRNIAIFISMLFIGLFALIIFLGFKLDGCVSQAEAAEFDFRFTDSVVAYDVFGNKEVTPVCDF
jgi:hypothetical protein|tara:strand:- start:81 stop:560 length:480 start_codon:yes stop_codon:yes gene_type:complete